MTTLKPILRYPGAKWLLADWITEQFPKHNQYIEPYCGSAAVFLNKEPAGHEVINDLNGDIVNLFRIMRSRMDELTWAIHLTPWSREEYYASYEPVEDELERARRFLVRCWQAHGTRLNNKSGWRHAGQSATKSTVSAWKKLPDRLAATIERLRDAEIECKPALDVISEYPDALPSFGERPDLSIVGNLVKRGCSTSTDCQMIGKAHYSLTAMAIREDMRYT